MEGRAEELKEQRNNYALEIAFDALWSLSPVISVVVAFLVYTKIQGHVLTPSIAFTSFGPSSIARRVLISQPSLPSSSSRSTPFRTSSSPRSRRTSR